MADAKIPGAAQDRQGVVDKQAARRVETDIGLQGVPELWAFLGETIVVGADQLLEVRRQFDALQFQRQRVAVRIGDQDHTLAGLLDGGQEGVGVRAQGDQVGGFQLQFADRNLQLRSPEVQAVPLELAGVVLEQRLQLQLGHGPADAVQFGITLGQVLQPEMVVVVQVEQGAVHIQQDGVDIAPGERGHGELLGPVKEIRHEQSGQPRYSNPLSPRSRPMRQKPTVLAREIVASSRLFRVEQVQLRFANGAERTYERLVGRGAGYGAVMIVAMLDAEHAVLVEEYCGGTDEYELSLPKGLIEPGEDVLAAAERELKEEAGYGARQLEHLTELSLSPGYMSQKIQVVLATELYEESLEGDEPEPMGVDKVNLRELSALVQNPQFTEGRALAALYLVRDLLTQRGVFQP